MIKPSLISIITSILLIPAIILTTYIIVKFERKTILQEPLALIKDNIFEKRIKCLEGNCSDGKGIALYNGLFVFHSDFKYNGNYKNNLPEGYGIITTNNGYTISGSWKSGKRNGRFQIINEKNENCICEYNDDKVNGTAIKQYEDLSSLVVNFKSDNIDSDFIHTNIDGDIYIGQGLLKFCEYGNSGYFFPDGYGTLIFKSGDKLYGKWNSGYLQNAYGRFNNFIIFKGFYNNNFCYGEGKFYYLDGTIKKGYIIEGKIYDERNKPDYNLPKITNKTISDAIRKLNL